MSEKVKDEKEKKNEVISGTFTAEDLAKLITTMAESNQEALKAFASELAYKIQNPDPTPAERENLLKQVQLRADRAREEDALKEHKRKHCVYPARPSYPHRRMGTEWGMFNGTSVIAWHYTTYSIPIGSTGQSREGMPVALGVCQWCQSEFKPGDPDYAEVVGWGLSTAIGTYPMNQRTGLWQ